MLIRKLQVAIANTFNVPHLAKDIKIVQVAEDTFRVKFPKPLVDRWNLRPELEAHLGSVCDYIAAMRPKDSWESLDL